MSVLVKLTVMCWVQQLDVPECRRWSPQWKACSWGSAKLPVHRHNRGDGSLQAQPVCTRAGSWTTRTQAGITP